MITENHWSRPQNNSDALVVNVLGRNAYLFRDKLNNYHFAIETAYEAFDVIRTQGLEVHYNEIAIGEVVNLPVIHFRCTHQSFLSLFVRVLNEIISSSQSGAFEVHTRSVLSVWIRFLEKPRRSELDEKSILGLIGELLVVEKMSEIKIEPSRILSTWTGPDKQSKDFTFQTLSIEVKASSKDSGHVHTINGIEQLDSLNGKLYLMSFHFKKATTTNSFTLNDIVNRLDGSVFEVVGLREQFFDKLYDYGYDKRDEEAYRSVEVTLVSEKLLFVNDEFPKLTNESIIDGLDSRISKVRYDVDANSLVGIELVDISNGLH